MLRMIVLLSLLLLPPGAARAHEYWLEPSKYTAVANDTVIVRAFVGTGFRGELKPYAPTRIVRLELHAGTRRDLAGLAVNGDLAWARFLVPDDRGAVVAYQSNFAALEMEPAKFDAYLAVEGLDEARAAFAQHRSTSPVRELYARCCKTWIAGRDVARVQATLGLRHEIVALDDPLRAARLRVRVLFDGKPRAQALVRAWRTAEVQHAAERDSVGPEIEVRTGPDGGATLDVSRPGEWLVSTVHMLPSSLRHADYESYWASLTFVRPAGVSREK